MKDKEENYSEMYKISTWYTIDKFIETQVGKNHGFKSLKAKRDWILSKGFELVKNADGLEGVAVDDEDSGTMKLKRGSKFATERVRKQQFDDAEVCSGFCLNPQRHCLTTTHKHR
jgi:hypothetical protein